MLSPRPKRRGSAEAINPWDEEEDEHMKTVSAVTLSLSGGIKKESLNCKLRINGITSF